MMILRCLNCGAEFPSARRKRKFCSKKCSVKVAWEARHRRHPVEERFWIKVDKNGPLPSHCPELGNCWIWIGSKKGGQRYGSFSILGRDEFAHRVSFFLHHGRWPVFHVLHKCDNGFCVRDSHLWEGTHAENMQDCANKHRSGIAVATRVHSTLAAQRTTCSHGHPYSPENVKLAKNRNSPRYRQCKTCNRLRTRAYRERKKVLNVNARISNTDKI